jgi:hypothetical protein
VYRTGVPDANHPTLPQMTHEAGGNEMFVPYDRLIEIDLCGRAVMVPENNSILRCLQFLAMEKISHADLCWNGDCDNCRVTLLKKDKVQTTIACRTLVKAGMKIIELSTEIDILSEVDEP